ncbi:MAG: septum formation initiator family protein [Candidatus Omnitrophica bacterium]|nr:septum formation initiator family protein [Candidatus Omnitrophota bacterium]
MNLCFLIFIGIRGKNYYSAYKTLKFYESEILRLKKENKILAEKIDRIKNDPFYIEKLLRENYGMIKEGEYIIKLGD